MFVFWEGVIKSWKSFLSRAENVGREMLVAWTMMMMTRRIRGQDSQQKGRREKQDACVGMNACSRGDYRGLPLNRLLAIGPPLKQLLQTAAADPYGSLAVSPELMRKRFAERGAAAAQRSTQASSRNWQLREREASASVGQRRRATAQDVTRIHSHRRHHRRRRRLMDR